MNLSKCIISQERSVIISHHHIPHETHMHRHACIHLYVDMMPVLHWSVGHLRVLSMMRTFLLWQHLYVISKGEVPTPRPSIGKSAPLNRLENFSSVNSDAKTVVLTLYCTEVLGTSVNEVTWGSPASVYGSPPKSTTPYGAMSKILPYAPGCEYGSKSSRLPL